MGRKLTIQLFSSYQGPCSMYLKCLHRETLEMIVLRTLTGNFQRKEGLTNLYIYFMKTPDIVESSMFFSSATVGSI